MSAHALAPVHGRTRGTVRRFRAPILMLLASTLLASALPALTAAPAATAATTEAGTIVLRPATKSMPSTWKPSFVIPYGTSKSKLGLGIEGDGKGVPVGPNYGAQAPDGTWWFIDTHKFRFAHYSRSGKFIEAVSVPKRFRPNGVYFPHQMPRVLNDGTLVAGNVVDNATNLLRVKNGAVSQVRMNREAIFRADDGRRLYGFDWNGPAVKGNPNTGAVTDVKYFRARSGDRYLVTVRGSKLRVRLPDATNPVDRSWNLTSADGKPVVASVEVATGVDGTLHLFFTGFEKKGGTKDLTAYTTITPKGRLGKVERTMSPFGPGDPGSPSRLGVRPKRNTPWLMFVRKDGVHVYQRATS